MKITFAKWINENTAVIPITYDMENTPIMVELTAQDKVNINAMLPHCTKYAILPDDWTEEQRNTFMGVKE